MPRRTVFVYNFEDVTEEGIVPDVPTTVRRSKADCPKVRCPLAVWECMHDLCVCVLGTGGAWVWAVCQV